MNFIDTLHGFKVFVDNSIKYKTVKREWKERLFTLPWHPFVKFKQVPDGYFMEDGKVIRMHDKIICNPITMRHLETAIKEK